MYYIPLNIAQCQVFYCGIIYVNTEIEQRVVGEILSASESWDNMQVLADDIGSRLAGSHGEVAARDFLIETLNRYGVDRVDIEPFPHLGWECKGEALSLIHI